jgi:hypothetical protein
MGLQGGRRHVAPHHHQVAVRKKEHFAAVAGDQRREQMGGDAQPNPAPVLRPQAGQGEVHRPAALGRAHQPFEAIQKTLVPMDEGIGWSHMIECYQVVDGPDCPPSVRARP